MASMDIAVRIRAIDQATKTMDRIRRKMREMERTGTRVSAAAASAERRARRAETVASIVPETRRPPVALPPVTHSRTTETHSPRQPSSLPAGVPVAPRSTRARPTRPIPMAPARREPPQLEPEESSGMDGFAPYGLSAGMMGGIGVGVLAKEAVTAAATFEAAMNRVRAALQATDPQMTQLQALALEMGRTTQFSANEAGLAIEMLAKNGLDTAQIIGGALKTSMDVAAASGSDLSSSADVVTDVMANFRIEASGLGKVADGITGVLLQSKFGFDDYGLALAQAGGVAGGMGVTMQDFNASIAATSSTFASGSDAGTSFKTFLARLVPASESAANSMNRLKLEFFDKKRNMKSMSEIAQELQDGLKGLSDEARNNHLQNIFGTDAIRTALALAAAGAKGLESVQAKIGNASAADQAAARTAGLLGQIEQVSSALEGLGIELGDLTLPGLTQFLEKATAEVNSFATSVRDASTIYETLRKALTGDTSTPGGFDPKGTFDDWWGPFNKKRQEAEDQAKKTVAALSIKSPKSGAVGAMGARDTDGVTSANLLAGMRNTMSRLHGETPGLRRDREAFLEKQQAPDQYDPSSSLSQREWLQQKRKQEAAAAATSAQVAAETSDLGRKTGTIPAPHWRPAPAIPIPTRRVEPVTVPAAGLPGKDSRLPSGAGPNADRFGGAPDVAATASIDIVSFMAGINTMDAAAVEAARPIYATADINTASFIAGLGTMQGAARAAVANINATLAGIRAPAVGAGSGSEYGAVRRSQFAPVTPGGGT